jgi:hypothetical protein
MESVSLINHRKSTPFILHSPYCRTQHIAEYGELSIFGTLRPVICWMIE